MDLDLAKKSIRGMFWLPDQKDKAFSGTLRLKADKSARLDTASFNNDSTPDWFLNRPKLEKGKTITLTGEDCYKVLMPLSPKIIHGLDEQGTAVTLLDCNAGSFRSPLAMESHRFSYTAANLSGYHTDHPKWNTSQPSQND